MSLTWWLAACQRYRVPLLVALGLLVVPWWVAYFYRVLGLAAVVGCALPLSP